MTTSAAPSVRAHRLGGFTGLLALALVAATVVVPSARASTAGPLEDGGWHLVAHMSDSGGMFDGDTQLAPDASYGTFVGTPSPSTPDFQRAFPVTPEDILFMTGDGTVWATADYAQLRALIDARAGALFVPNLTFERSIDGVESSVTGNVLSRQGNVEDPWISIADGDHFAGTGQGLVVWGENDWDDAPGHLQLKNSRGGINVYVRNPGPSITAVAAPLEPVRIGSAADVAATFTDASSTDSHTCTIDHGNGVLSGGTIAGTTCSNSYTYGEPGVYDVTVTVRDLAGNQDVARTTVVVYDPTAGFVTGGGWIESPRGALASDPDATGRANFGFVSRYRRGAETPEGRTLFRFRAGDLHFTADSYQWLVVAGGRAQFKGTGALDGVPGHDFMLTAVDGTSDSFRIRITRGDTVIYDNHTAGGTTELGGGSIVIQR